MIAVLASAKALDFEGPWRAPRCTLPECLDGAQTRMDRLRPWTSSSPAGWPTPTA